MFIIFNTRLVVKLYKVWLRIKLICVVKTYILEGVLAGTITLLIILPRNQRAINDKFHV